MLNTIMFTLIGVLVYILITQIDAPYDNTDNVKTKERSWLVLYTDYGTGNQYISTICSNFISRLDVNGTQVNIYTNPIKEK